MEVTTIFMANISSDATCRELENLVRFFPGYEAMKVSAGKGGKGNGTAMFVKFESIAAAMAAQKALNGHPFDTAVPDQLMRVEMAKKDMKTTGGTPAPPRIESPYDNFGHNTWSEGPIGAAPTQPYLGPPGGPRKRPRGVEDPNEVDTLVLLGQLEKGFTENQLEDFFSQVSGFLAFKANARVGGAFVKFTSPAAAHAALETAASAGIEAQVARSSMNYTPNEPDWVQPPPPSVPPLRAPAWDRGGAPPGGKGRYEPPGSVDTLVLLGQLEKGFTESQLEDFFSQVPGFVAFKPNARIGGAFVKFSSPAMAQEALAIASDSGIDAQVARSSMNTTGHGKGDGVPSLDEPDWMQPPPSNHSPAHVPPKRARVSDAPGNVDTLILQGQFEKGFTETQLEDFFVQVPGFIAYKSSPRVGGAFVKFSTPALAQEALLMAMDAGIEAQMARSSMTSVGTGGLTSA